MAFVIKLNPTVTGGTDTTLTLVTQEGASSTWTFPTGSHLEPNQVKVKVTSPSLSNKADPGVARTSFRVSKATRISSEGCCDVQSGDASIEILTRWHLNQPEANLDQVIAQARALVLSDEFVDAIKQGLTPAP